MCPLYCVWISVLTAGRRGSGHASCGHKQLAKIAAEGGADAIKFQTVDTEEIMSGDTLTIDYETPNGKRQESIFKALERRRLKDGEWRELKSTCDELGLLFISTPSGERTIDLLVDMGNGVLF